VKENSFFVLLGFVGIISIAGLVLMFTNFQSAAGGIFIFEQLNVESRTASTLPSCEEICNILEKGIDDLQDEFYEVDVKAKQYPYDENFKNQRLDILKKIRFFEGQAIFTEEADKSSAFQLYENKCIPILDFALLVGISPDLSAKNKYKEVFCCVS